MIKMKKDNKKMKKMNRKGNSSFDFVRKIKISPKSKLSQGHIEMILSFVLFLGALIVLFIFVNPFAKTEEVSIIGGIQSKIISEVSLEIGKISAIPNIGSSCYDFTENEYPGNYMEKQVDSRKYDIYFGEIFNNFTPNRGCGVDQYSIGTYSSEKMIAYNKIEELVLNYNADYEGLKRNLGITSDFSFSFTNLLGEEQALLSVSKDVPAGVNVEAKEYPVRIIDSGANIQELILNIRAWE